MGSTRVDWGDISLSVAWLSSSEYFAAGSTLLGMRTSKGMSAFWERIGFSSPVPSSEYTVLKEMLRDRSSPVCLPPDIVMSGLHVCMMALILSIELALGA